jgi:hypothetical protein
LNLDEPREFNAPAAPMMGIGPGEPPGSVPATTDLAFRVRRSGPLERADGVLVCPYEQAVPMSCPPITCERRRICFDRPSRPPARP